MSSPRSTTLMREGVAEAFESGDVLFVAAGETHRVEEFSEDFATWVVFYGEIRVAK